MRRGGPAEVLPGDPQESSQVEIAAGCDIFQIVQYPNSERDLKNS